MKLQPTLVVPGVWLLPFEIGQVYIWDRGARLTIVDSGIAGSAEAILEAIRAIGRRPEDVEEIVLTHYHDDHRGGAAELARRTGARIVAHRTEAPVIPTSTGPNCWNRSGSFRGWSSSSPASGTARRSSRTPRGRSASSPRLCERM